jgi:hypothetical protein
VPVKVVVKVVVPEAIVGGVSVQNHCAWYAEPVFRSTVLLASALITLATRPPGLPAFRFQAKNCITLTPAFRITGDVMAVIQVW